MPLRHDIIERGVPTTGHTVEPATVVSVAHQTADDVAEVGLLLGVVELDAEADAGVHILIRATGLGEALDERSHLGLGEVEVAFEDGFGGLEVGHFGFGVIHRPSLYHATSICQRLFLRFISGWWRGCLDGHHGLPKDGFAKLCSPPNKSKIECLTFGAGWA